MYVTGSVLCIAGLIGNVLCVTGSVPCVTCNVLYVTGLIGKVRCVTGNVPCVTGNVLCAVCVPGLILTCRVLQVTCAVCYRSDRQRAVCYW